MKAEIDPDRMRALLDGINDFGRNPATGGFNRQAFADADQAVRAWFADVMRADGLAVRVDQVGNMFGRFGAPDGPSILIGSHLDTVAEGGGFDGALGVTVGLECVRAMKAAGIAPTTAIQVVATADEEGRFGGMLGSQAIAGVLPDGWVDAAEDAGGVRLADAMRAAGFDPKQAVAARMEPDDVVAFLELHIEQGPVLDRQEIPLGIVTGVSGVSVLQVTLEGVANHSGTTPMDMRADAFAGLAGVGAAIDGIIAAHGTAQSRITVGRVELAPNDVHTIPQRAEFSVVIRDTDRVIMQSLKTSVEAAVRQSAADHGLTFDVSERSWLDPVELDVPLRQRIGRAADRFGIPHLEMQSGAGHDAQTMQSLCPSALVFVPSRRGISHAPAEHTEWPPIVTAAGLLLEVLCELSAG